MYLNSLVEYMLIIGSSMNIYNKYIRGHGLEISMYIKVHDLLTLWCERPPAPTCVTIISTAIINILKAL